MPLLLVMGAVLLLTSPPVLLRGVRKPQVSSHPDHVFSYGPFASELAAAAGLILDPWQSDALDIMLGLRHDDRFSCFEFGLIVPRQNGKGAVLEARVLAGLFILKEELILWSAHQYKTAMEMYRRVQALIRNCPELHAQVKRYSGAHGEEGIELKTGQRLKFIARSKDSGRGFSGDCNIVDEAYAYTDEQNSALMPALSARPNPQIIYASSPPLDEITGDVLRNLRARGEAGDDPDLGWLDWGAKHGADLDDISVWAATNPALGYRAGLSVETIRRERAGMRDRDFARERLGIWSEAVTAHIIDPDLWQQLADTGSTITDPVAFAVDVTPARDYAAIAAASVRPDGLTHVEVVEHRPGVDWLVPQLAQLRDKWNPVGIGLDRRGPAGSLLLDLSKLGIVEPDGEPQRGQLAVPGPQDMTAACGQFIDACRQKTLRHRNQDALNVALAGAKTASVGDSTKWTRKDAKNDLSPLYAVTLARWTYETRAHVASQDFNPGVWFL